VSENAAFLAGRVREVALLFFQTEACLAYGEEDLPPSLAGLPLSWHLHLPLDLPWDRGAEATARTVAALADKAAFLAPRGMVLHPPPGPGLLGPMVRGLAREMAQKPGQERGQAPEQEPGRKLDRQPAKESTLESPRKGQPVPALWVENTVRESLPAFWEEICGCGCGVCLDLGHLLLAGDEARTLALPGLFERVRAVHVSAPGPYGGGHAPLSALDRRGRDLLRHVLEGIKEDSVVVLELFDLPGLAESAGLLARWGREWRLW
jgi:hypothetical protein